MALWQRLEEFAYSHPTVAAFAIAIVAVSAIALAFSVFAAATGNTHYLHNDVARVAFHTTTASSRPGCLYA
ncbi:hypothetical protein NTE_01840 [Candidatus Nitrososphaera evergladensis SR1]|jgi:hypothetical protein|uniref:Uncharacterized protein n=1 Tax=Candidatus Nitrososphaera evergladensis SR1 TaxID=1459636 RepID=A0A075MS17_9ARCH|nr:hypothetical protein [Candidatus Nitrososphaera evergladensis]AIF83900.1 hypothetical protein NTE_01840 [Candidatus Nitrososphaera evergladensis SR1]